MLLIKSKTKIVEKISDLTFFKVPGQLKTKEAELLKNDSIYFTAAPQHAGYQLDQ